MDEGVRDKRGIDLCWKICGGGDGWGWGGNGHSRVGQENQRMGEGRRKPSLVEIPLALSLPSETPSSLPQSLPPRGAAQVPPPHQL